MFAYEMIVPDSVVRIRDIADCRPEVRELRDLWESLRGARPMPARADFRPSDARHLLRHILLVEIGGPELPRERRYRVRLFGTAQVDYLGVDWTGAYFHDKTDRASADRFCDLAEAIVAAREPWVVRGGLFWMPDKPYAQFESIYLPLSDDGDVVNMLLGLTIFY